jgi:hypothetical protein
MTEQKKDNAPTEEPKEELTTFDTFMLKHMDRCEMWAKDHPNHERDPFPIVNLGNGEFRWLNRAERRRMK